MHGANTFHSIIKDTEVSVQGASLTVNKSKIKLKSLSDMVRIDRNNPKLLYFLHLFDMTKIFGKGCLISLRKSQ